MIAFVSSPILYFFSFLFNGVLNKRIVLQELSDLRSVFT